MRFLAAGMARLVPPLIALAAGSALVSGCEDEDQCFNDRDCSSGQRCEGAGLDGPGICIDCDPAEVPYDGEDNDCNARTRDIDLDGDGQNAVGVPFQPGMDCNDQDPSIFSGAPEMCGDNIDSDCDGMGAPGTNDDPDCGDLQPPTVRVVQPTSGSRVSGQLPATLIITDDTGVVSITVRAAGAVVASQTISPLTQGQRDILIDTQTIVDGPVVFRFEVRDRADRMGEANVRVTVDNRTPPVIRFLRPRPGEAHRGRIPVEATLQDPDGVATSSATLTLDGVQQMLSSTSSVGITAEVDVESLSEGAYSLQLTAADTLGNTATGSVGFVVDMTGPQLRFLEPPVGATLMGSVRVAVTATGSSDFRELSVEGQTTRSNALDFMLDTTFLPNGPYTLTATASDQTLRDGLAGQGNQSMATRQVVIANVDNTPTIRFVRPVNGDTVLGRTTIEVAVGRGDGFNQVEFSVGSARVTVPRAPFLTAFDFRNGAGRRTIEAVVTDGAGRTARDSIQVIEVEAPRLRLPQVVSPIAGSISDFAVADFDGDGILDILTSGATMELYPGRRLMNGGYSNVGPTRIATAGLQRFVLGDLDGDGDPDAVSLDGSRLFTFTNDRGLALPSRSVDRLTVLGNDRLAVGNFDTDPDPEIVLAGATVAAAYVLDFVPTSTSYQLIQTLGGDGEVSQVIVADADNDMDLDIVVGRDRTNTVSVFRNDGMGRFGAGIDSVTGSAPITVAIGDVNGDGYPDLVAGTTRNVEFLAGNMSTPGAFGRVALGEGSAAGGVAIANMDNDSNLEIVTVDNLTQSLSIWSLNNRALIRDASYMVGDLPRGLEVVDLDGRGGPEVMVGLPQGVARIENAGNSRLRAPLVFRPGFDVGEFEIGQILGSSAVDLLMVDNRGEQVRILEGDGRFGFTEQLTLSAPGASRSFSSVAIGQLDGVRGIDIAATLSGGGIAAPNSVIYLANTSGAYDENSMMGVFPNLVRIGDFDGDNQNEVAFGVSSPDTMVNGARILNAMGMQEAYPTGGQSAFSMTVGQFNGTDTALAISNSVSENIAVIERMAMSTSYSTTIYNAPSGLRRINSGRMGTDTLDDIAGVTRTETFYLEANAALGFNPPVITRFSRNAVEAHFLDTNRDGLNDIVTLANGRMYIQVARASGGFLPPLEYSFATSGARLRKADVDGDMRMDLVSTHGLSRIVVIVPNDDDSF